MSLSQFQNPKIHSDLLQIFRELFGVHRNRGKYLRITVLEKEILEKLTACMRVTIEINRWLLPPNPSQMGRGETTKSNAVPGGDAVRQQNFEKPKNQVSSLKLQSVRETTPHGRTHLTDREP